LKLGPTPGGWVGVGNNPENYNFIYLVSKMLHTKFERNWNMVFIKKKLKIFNCYSTHNG
jgi:hypothetical protein